MTDLPVVFISHSTVDVEVANAVCRCLEQRGVACWIAPRNISYGTDWDEAISRGLDGCRVVVFLFSAASDKSEHVKRELNLAIDKKKFVLPVRIEQIPVGRSLEYVLAGKQWLEAHTGDIDGHLGKLCDRVVEVLGAVPVSAAPAPVVATPAEKPEGVAAAPVRKAAKAMKLALLYKRNAQPDDHVLATLEEGLKAAGHDVFVDRHLRVGVEWAREIERQVREADAVIPLISGASIHSEMLNMELQTAAEAAQRQFGKPRIFPVRVNFEKGQLEEPMLSILGRLQYASWSAPADDARLLNEMLDSLEAKEQPKPDKDKYTGPVPFDSPYYVVKPTDQEFYDALDQQDSIVLVKGVRQMGKTSLLARGLREARKAAKTVIVLDFQKLNQSDLADIKMLYLGLGGMIADQLFEEYDIAVKYPQDSWREESGASVNFGRYLRREVLDKIEGHVVIAMDEVDRLFTCPYASEVFGLFRSWYNERATNPDGPWGRLTLAIVYATEAHLFITDQNQSPFNVGTQIELKDFNIEQVEKLNQLYGRPIGSPEDMQRFYALFHGQPYLSRRGLHFLTHNDHTMDQLVAEADTDEGPLGDHLRRILVVLAKDKDLLEVVTGLVHGKPIPDMKSFYRLRSGGLVVGSSTADAQFRCGIYKTYLARHLA
jgi:nucleotide-binding universal stress UspA family protein